MLKLIPFFLLSFLLTAYATILDDDMDGVENRDDLCPNSSLIDIVDATGCTVEKLQDENSTTKKLKQHHFDISLGYNYTKYDDNNSQDAQSISFGYYYKNFSAYFYTSTYSLDSGESGMDDSMLAFYYRFIVSDISYQVGVGSYIPTDDKTDNKTDYFIKSKITYMLDKQDIALSFQHTFTKDDFIEDTNRLILNYGYMPSDKSYLSISYTLEDSIFKYEDRLQDISLYGSYYLTKNWFASSSISVGVSDSASDFSTSFSIGYYY
jgi:hypothetical protein